MRRLILLAVLVVGLAACGGSAAPKGTSKGTLKITLGLSGGTMMTYSVTIAPGGAVTTQGNPPAKPKPITSAQDDQLSRLVRGKLWVLRSEQCKGTFPDESARFITANDKTVTVRGACEPAFTHLWDELANALGLS